MASIVVLMDQGLAPHAGLLMVNDKSNTSGSVYFLDMSSETGVSRQITYNNASDFQSNFGYDRFLYQKIR